MQRQRALDELLLGFGAVRVGYATLHGAHRLAGFHLVEAHALAAELRVDDVELVRIAAEVEGGGSGSKGRLPMIRLKRRLSLS